jgi:hypothetical protein
MLTSHLMAFSLLKDKWIPIVLLPSFNTAGDGIDAIASLEEVISQQNRIVLGGSPFLWLSLWRLLAALRIDDGLLSQSPWTLDKNPLLSKFECSSEGTRADDFLNLVDGNSVAWNCPSSKELPPRTIAQAMVQAYFSDRAGIKARVEGFSMSGASPPHLGKTSVFRYGATLGEMLDLNIDPAWGEDEYQFLMHKWRQVKVEGDRIVVAANLHYKGAVVDPWSKDSGRLKHIKDPQTIPVVPPKKRKKSDPEPITEEQRFFGVTLCLMQAKLLACDSYTFTQYIEVHHV